MRLKTIILICIFIVALFLRFYKIDQIPHGLYIDEVSIGNNAYSILTDGKDEHGISYPLFFRAFGEYKMPVDIYMTSVSIAAFGKNEFAIRFPSAFFGTFTVLLMYLFVRELLLNSKSEYRNSKPTYAKASAGRQIENTNDKNSKYSLEIPVVAAALLAVSPWHIQFSRANFEANIALFFYLLGGFLFLKFLQNKNSVFLFAANLAFITTIYTYNAYKLISLITLFVILLRSFQYLRGSRSKFGMTFITVILLLPMLFFSLSPEGNSRFLETSAFAESSANFLQYPMIYLKNYLSYFSLPYLFISGDGIGRHSVYGMGPIFRFELPFLLIGLYFLFKQKKAFFAKSVFFLAFVAPVTAAFAIPSPHLLRSLLLVVPLTIIISYGLLELWQKKGKFLKIFFVAILLFALYEVAFYFHYYYSHYPMRTALDFGAEYKQVVLSASKLQTEYPLIIISSNVGMIGSYINFYENKLNYELVDNSWKKPIVWKDKKVLYITTADMKKNIYLSTVPHKLIQNIYFPNLNHDIFAQFWEI